NELYGQQVVMNTIRAIRQNFYTLGILGDIWEQVRSYTKERNLFLIADSSRFLRGIIGGNQVPFIYERTGNRFRHIMLDEFQDTSVFQYDNFRPLLDNALASGFDNLVVGDVKQSIYRWRNSDWKILANDLENDFRHQEYKVYNLDKNYRSRDQIIRFNNTVFQAAPRILAQRIESELFGSTVDLEEAENQVDRFRAAYADAVQQIPERAAGSGGMVKVELFGEMDGIPFRERVLSRIPRWIEELQQHGIDPGEIAILVRSRKEGISVANRLLEEARQSGERHMFRLISNESLLLIHNTSVTLIISALRYLVHPSDELNNALLKYQYFLSGSVPEGATDRLFDSELPMDQSLPGSFFVRNQSLKQLPLYELVEHLIELFELGERVQDLPYLQALQDLVIDLNRREPVGIPDFLSFWEQHGRQQGISISEESNAIRILTIHKAKGLEFKAVLVPFCNWEITTDQKKSNVLWCETRETPFGRIPIVPVRYSGQLQHTLFSSSYSQERMKGYMDSLNMMYVAFTRAKDALYIGVPDPEKAAFSDTGDLLRAVFEKEPELPPALRSLGTYRSGQVIQVGQMPVYEKGSSEPDPWKFDSYPVDQRTRTLRVRLRSDEYFVDEDGTFSNGLAFGTMMHQVFSKIYTAKDVEPLLNKMQKEGLIPGKERGGIQEKILGMIRQPGVEQWFSADDKRSVYNERNILCGEGKLLRPDRVIEEGDRVTIVDFKFGSVQKDQYMDQVREYMVQLEKMGYRETVGYIWYVMLGKTIQVRSDKVTK
ncbi:MAG: UvrD-helicase domain-containing protein, partial [Bacteroidales bacterium]|nr:UvrD-helicase domain-containing protein [Bacteroidales bacterium]